MKKEESMFNRSEELDELTWFNDEWIIELISKKRKRIRKN
jgi:hypothetical protein